jgi:deoxyribodipyrimidine photolyase-related protein
MAIRHLVIVLGDQLDSTASALEGFDPAQDCVWMCESADESSRTWSSKQRIAVFLAAMRHFAQALRGRAWPVEYLELSEQSLDQALAQSIARLKPAGLVVTEPGEWGVRDRLTQVSRQTDTPLDIRIDQHFLCTLDEFVRHAKGRKQLRMEYFYREMRRRHRVLMESDPQAADGYSPVGGQWNFDADNRESFGRDGPARVPARSRFEPDAITQSVLALVQQRFADHPGSLDEFAWPLTREQALQTLDDFIEQRLPEFGRWQDAMWAGEAWLYHSHLSLALNLKLLSPREVIAAAEKAWRAGHAPLPAVEGFIRQILGWREYVRGIYWLNMPDYLEANALQADQALPGWFWTGDTDMVCLRDAITQTLRLGYAHHIQRLMVTGLFALLYGVRPREVHAWYLSVYVDAVEWVELPNTLGMSQYADGGLMASKPYAATGKYIERMSNYCNQCPYAPAKRIGEKACPFTTLYWDFLLRHESRLASNPRMALQVKNLARIADGERDQIRAQSQALRTAWSDKR